MEEEAGWAMSRTCFLKHQKSSQGDGRQDITAKGQSGWQSEQPSQKHDDAPIAITRRFRRQEVLGDGNQAKPRCRLYRLVLFCVCSSGFLGELLSTAV